MAGRELITKENNALNEIFNKDFAELPKAYDLYNEFIGMSEIERLKEEDFVLKSIMSGKSERDILKSLKHKYPDKADKITQGEIVKFIERNRDVTEQMTRYVGINARRHFLAKSQCFETLSSLALYTQKLIVDLRKEKDNTNTIAAIRAFHTTLKTIMELENMIKPKHDIDSGGKTVINIISDKYDLKEQAHRADFKIMDV